MNIIFEITWECWQKNFNEINCRFCSHIQDCKTINMRDGSGRGYVW